MEERMMPGRSENPGAKIETEEESAVKATEIRMLIGPEEVRKAETIRKKYAEGKKSVDERLKEDYKWYKLQANLFKEEDGQVKPISGQLLNAMANKHADAMDCMPHPDFLPHERRDEEEAKRLSSVVPVILDRCNFKKIWSQVWWDKVISGNGAYGIFWDPTAENGLGDINIVRMNLLNLFWQPGVTDIQQSRNLFSVELWDNEAIKERWPEAAESLGKGIEIAKYANEQNIDTKDKSYVVDWYYKKLVGGKTILHYCRYIGDTVIYATENNPDTAERGIYDHGRYPFEIDVLYPEQDSVTGFGYVRIGKNTQEYNDRLKKAMLENALWGARPRYFIKKSASFKVEDFADANKSVIEIEAGSLDDTQVKPMVFNGIPSVYFNMLQEGKDELKEETGNRDVSTGGTTSGVTAASAIAAMQEAGSKLSRDHISMGYDVFRDVCRDILELLRQFYDLKRWFRITGENGKREYIEYSNEFLAPERETDMIGEEIITRVPEFDIEITVEKESPYTRMSQNEMALSFYQSGFFDPNNVDQALATVEMMDFDGKEKVIETIRYNGTIMQKYQQLANLTISAVEELDIIKGTNNASALAGKLGMEMQSIKPGDASIPQEKQESGVTAAARERVAEASTPR